MAKDLTNKVIQGDSLEVMREMADKSVDLIVIDPPYNIGKDERWDKYESVDAYVEFMSEVFTECERVIKDTGSFYWFHNDMTQIRKLMDAIDERTDFVYKQFIVWNKRFNEASNKGFLDGFIEVEKLRNYQKMAEYCLFYTKQDDYGNNQQGFGFKELRDYFASLLKATGMTKRGIMEKVGQRADHCFRSNSTQWDLPTEETYAELAKLIDPEIFVVKSYRELLRAFEESRYTYNNQRTHHSIWNYEVAPKLGHITPKPVDLIENIIRHSSNEGDVVLDCFLGSGTTAVATINTGRNYIGIERESEYVDLAERRIGEALAEKEAIFNGQH